MIPKYTHILWFSQNIIGIKLQTNVFSTDLKVVSFFYRAMLTLGLIALALWPVISGLYRKTKVRY